MLQLLLDPRKMLGLADRTCTNDHVRLAGQDGAGQLGNVLAFILVVCIRVDNHVCAQLRSEEHTSELQSLMRISYAVFCLKKKKYDKFITHNSKHYTTIN